MSTVRIPADINQEDKLLSGLTARQLLILACPAVVLWLIYMATRRFIPLVAFAPFAIIVAGATGALVVTKRDGLSMDHFVAAAIRHQRSSRRRVLVSNDDLILPPGISALGLPVVGVQANGVIDLGGHGAAVISIARAVNLALQSEREQEAITAAFGRYCNSFHDSVQFAIRSQPISLESKARDLEDRALALPAVGLEQAARDHAQYLRELASRHDMLRRNVFVVHRDKRPIDQSSETLIRQAQDAAPALRLAGVEIARLDGHATIAVLQQAMSPNGAQIPLFDSEVVIGVQV